ncbi:MAG: type II secretion system minor pseudopilin GspK [Pigmentiphaga sp.]|nr:type II secretion system minor pseudopilin GspK [Pigmentiphaga sp.]
MRRRRSSPASRRAAAKGMAVIGALLIVLVATVLVTGLLQRQDIDVRAAENRYLQAQGQWLLRGGMDWASMVLRFDGRRYNTTEPGQLWSIPVEDTRVSQSDTGRVAVFSGRIEDEQGKFNLRNLAEGGVLQPAAYEGLQRLLPQLGLPPGLAQVLAQRIAIAQPLLSADGTVIRPPQAPMPQLIDDLLALEAVTPEVLEALRPYLTVLPEATALNANTASAETLVAAVPGLSLGHARSLVAQRDRGVWFRDTSDFLNRLASPDLNIDASTIVVNSHWFLVKGAVTLDHAVVATRALLQRSNRDTIQPVWIREFH